MPAFDDDEVFENYRVGDGDGRRGSDDDELDDRDDPDPRDITPDELDTVRCANCRKYIFEDCVRCPYCKHLQMEDERNRKPMWFILTVALVLAMLLVGYLIWGFS